MPRVYIETYGCTLNQADSDIMRAVLIEKGYDAVDIEEKSDAVIINTCTVKGATENKILARIKSLTDAKKKIVIAGCLTANEQKIRKFAPLAPIVGTSSLKNISDAIDAAMHNEAKTYKTFESKDALPKMITAPIMRIPINDGCTSACYFCQTKLARPFLRSYSPKTIVKWINESVAHGAREIQLTSMDSGAYGLDIKTNLINLLGSIAKDDSGNSKKSRNDFLIRLGMINPNHAKRMLPQIIEALKQDQFYKFLHVPVQTGSENVCKEMNRDHSVQDFVEIVNALRKAIPEITIATDIIVGYPTETEDDFEATCQLLKATCPDIANVSKFSPRPGTKAKELKQLSNDEIKRRSRITSELVKEIEADKNKALMGNAYRVLITEKQQKQGDFTGRNINYKQVVVKNFNGKLGEFVNVKIYDANYGSLFGKIL